MTSSFFNPSQNTSSDKNPLVPSTLKASRLVNNNRKSIRPSSIKSGEDSFVAVTQGQGASQQNKAVVPLVLIGAAAVLLYGCTKDPDGCLPLRRITDNSPVNNQLRGFYYYLAPPSRIDSELGQVATGRDPNERLTTNERQQLNRSFRENFEGSFDQIHSFLKVYGMNCEGSYLYAGLGALGDESSNQQLIDFFDIVTNPTNYDAEAIASAIGGLPNHWQFNHDENTHQLAFLPFYSEEQADNFAVGVVDPFTMISILVDQKNRQEGLEHFDEIQQQVSQWSEDEITSYSRTFLDLANEDGRDSPDLLARAYVSRVRSFPLPAYLGDGATYWIYTLAFFIMQAPNALLRTRTATFVGENSFFELILKAAEDLGFYDFANVHNEELSSFETGRVIDNSFTYFSEDGEAQQFILQVHSGNERFFLWQLQQNEAGRLESEVVEWAADSEFPQGLHWQMQSNGQAYAFDPAQQAIRTIDFQNEQINTISLPSNISNLGIQNVWYDNQGVAEQGPWLLFSESQLIFWNPASSSQQTVQLDLPETQTLLHVSLNQEGQLFLFTQDTSPALAEIPGMEQALSHLNVWTQSDENGWEVISSLPQTQTELTTSSFQTIWNPGAGRYETFISASAGTLMRHVDGVFELFVDQSTEDRPKIFAHLSFTQDGQARDNFWGGSDNRTPLYPAEFLQPTTRVHVFAPLLYGSSGSDLFSTHVTEIGDERSERTQRRINFIDPS